MGVSPQSCAVVEDSVSGMRAGLAAGMHVFAFHPPGSLADDLKDRVEVLHRLTDLLAMPWNQRLRNHDFMEPAR
jgi:beta-phosphoglucomutase-like phosphatase (HAD superfamily)